MKYKWRHQSYNYLGEIWKPKIKNRTLIGNKARFQLERRAWIEIARMESEAGTVRDWWENGYGDTSQSEASAALEDVFIGHSPTCEATDGWSVKDRGSFIWVEKP